MKVLEGLTTRGTERKYIRGLEISKARRIAMLDMVREGVPWGGLYFSKTIHRIKDRFDISVWEISRISLFKTEVPVIDVVDIELLKDKI